MNRPFAIYQNALDDNVLGYWRFGENAGRLIPIGVGPTFTNYGAIVEQDGYRFVRADGDYMAAAFPDQPPRSQLTLEVWIRDWQLPAEGTGWIAYLSASDGSNFILFTEDYGPVDGRARITIAEEIEGYPPCYARWLGTEVRDLLLGADPVHISGVLNADDGWLRLYLNGEQKAEIVTGVEGLPAENYSFYLNHLWSANHRVSAILDEVRLSKCARYDANFPVVRFGEGRRALTRGPEVNQGLFAGVIR